MKLLAYSAYLALATLFLLEAALHLLQPLSSDLDSILYLPSTRARFEQIDSLEDLMREAPMLGFVPHRERIGFVLNSRSLRTREYAGRERGDAIRIVSVGDSFTFASGGTAYSRMWFTVLGRELESTLGVDVETLALGVPGVGPRFELRLWELEQDLLQPDLVVLAFFIGNDFTDEHRLGRRERVKDFFAYWSLSFRLLRNLSLLRAESALREAYRHEHDRVFPTGGYETEIPLPTRFSPEAFLRLEQTNIWITIRENQEDFERLAEDAGEVLARFRDAVEATNSGFVVLLIPDVYQVDPALREWVLTSLGLGEEDIDLDRPQRHLRQILDASGIAYLDLLPSFREAAASQPLYRPRNNHWNDEGNALAGKLLARHLWAEYFAEGSPLRESRRAPRSATRSDDWQPAPDARQVGP